MNAELNRFDPNPDHPSTWLKTPSRLLVPGSNLVIPAPPIETRPQLLPFHDLAWEDFERLCLRLLELYMETVNVEEVGGVSGVVSRMYGQRGQAQFGIDIYSRDPLPLGKTPPKRRYVCLQARRVDMVNETALRAAVSDFVDNKWSSVARKFIYATSCSGVRTQFTDELEAQAEKLASDSIEFTVWDQEEMSQLLKAQPRLVDDFFGRAWVSSFCGSVQAESLGRRLDAHQVAELRKKLARIYGVTFQIADSGQLALKTAKSVRLHDRFVTPDVISTTPEGATEPIVREDLNDIDKDDFLYEISPEEFVLSRSEYEAERLPIDIAKRRQAAARRLNTEERLSAEAWLGTSMKQVIVGEPGAGKSTLLRYIVMDLLSDNPVWRMVAERWGGRLPIWLPFHYFTQRVMGNTGKSASISEAIKAWLEQHDFGDVWPLVEEALADERLLLIVDGLDEWVSDDAGRHAAAAVETFVESHSVAVIVTTRPYGLTHLTLGAGWNFARIAPLIANQQRKLAQVYFSIVAAGGEGEDAINSVAGMVDSFLSEIRSSPDLRAVSGIPLFMVLLIGLRLSTTRRLPERRFEVYDQAVQLLIADHPQRRRVAAAVTRVRDRLSERDTRAILDKVAYLSQNRGDISTISESVIHGDLVTTLTNPDYLGVGTASARDYANNILDIAEGELGLLVRKGPAEFGFLHRIIQEQLAAEYVADRLEPEEVKSLFVKHIGEPFWREVLLATIWRIKRPAELRCLVETIEKQVEETPAGMQAREFLAEIVFGEYGLPAEVIKRHAPILVDVADTHSYGTHRLRLMKAIFSGLNSTVTRSVVEACISRWAVLAIQPTANLVQSVSRLPADDRLSLAIDRVLLLSIGKPDISIAYTAAISIVKRCSNEGRGSISEHEALKEGLLGLISDPPSGICQSSALAALALGWRDDPVVDYAVHEARSHADANVRLVALADTVGVLSRILIDKGSNTSAEPLIESERNWLLSRLESTHTYLMHKELLAATIAQAMTGNQTDCDHLIKLMQKKTGLEQELIWKVALKAFPDDERIVNAVCELIRSEEHVFPLGSMMGYFEELRIYSPPSPHNPMIAQAIEDHLAKFGYKYKEVELFGLAAVDRGPIIRSALLDSLKISAFPYWISEALCQYFLQEEEVKLSLREMLLGDAIRASKIANVAPAVLDADSVVQRLLDILRQIKGKTKANARADIVTTALIEVCKANGITSGDIGEDIASQAIDLRTRSNRVLSGSTYDLAVAFYPTCTAKAALDALAGIENHFVTPFLEAYRDEPEEVYPFLNEAMCIIGSPPTQMRIYLCQLLSQKSISPDFVIAVTKHWPDEISGRNKSYASLAYHRALFDARNEGIVSDEEWEHAKAVLRREASCYGPDYESRRRAAWVGMSVLSDWSMVDGLTETIGNPCPVSVSLGDGWVKPDTVLLQQVASRWRDLHVHFGSDFLSRLSGIRGHNSLHQVWAGLSVVAAQYPEVERELESAIEDKPELLEEEPILLWFLSRPQCNSEMAAEVLVASLCHAKNNLRELADALITEPERIGIDRNSLLHRLESVASAHPLEGGYGNRPLEALAVAFPGHNLVKVAWEKIKKDQESKNECQRLHIHPQTFLAVAYSEVSSEEVLKLLRRNLTWLKQTDQAHYNEALTRHLSSRLRRDSNAAQMIAEAIVSSDTTDAEAAELASLLSVSLPLSEEVLENLKQRLKIQMDSKLAPIVQDRVLSVSLSARNLLTKVIEASGNR